MIDTNIGDKVYTLNPETFEIYYTTSKGIILIDKTRKNYKLYLANKVKLLISENCFIAQNNFWYSCSLEKIQEKRLSFKEQLQAKLIKEIRDRIKILRRVEADFDKVK